jgi:hypothetical protein
MSYDSILRSSLAKVPVKVKVRAGSIGRRKRLEYETMREETRTF